MNKLEQARDIVLNYDYPEDVLANCRDELSEDDFIFNGVFSATLLSVTPEKLKESLIHYIGIEKLNHAKNNEPPLGSSKLYGLPHLPKSADWPDNHYFYAQFNFAEITDYDAEGILPKSGILYLFINLNFTCRTLFYDGPIEDLVITDSPAHLDNSYLNKYKTIPTPIKFRSSFCFELSTESQKLNQVLNSLKDEITQATSIEVIDSNSRHSTVKMFGKATYVQGEDYVYLEEEEQLEDIDETMFDSYESTLLLEDEFAEGQIHFWISTKQLKQQNFDKVRVMPSDDMT